jgi:hypothetical protein
LKKAIEIDLLANISHLSSSLVTTLCCDSKTSSTPSAVAITTTLHAHTLLHVLHQLFYAPHLHKTLPSLCRCTSVDVGTAASVPLLSGPFPSCHPSSFHPLHHLLQLVGHNAHGGEIGRSTAIGDEVRNSGEDSEHLRAAVVIGERGNSLTPHTSSLSLSLSLLLSFSPSHCIDALRVVLNH